ncbi:MAG: PQQ-binding-like beta-propeller repeat protein, partial [Planctomycetota bacterium]|nr:PQQ-binding-like beta-propeller repeat protein [Planctomycetota bacterium]
MRNSLYVLLLLAFVPAHSQDGEVRLLTDDAIPRYLSRGQELARAEQWEKVVDVLHRVVIGDKEVFPDLKPEVLHSAVYSADGRVFYPARELCLKELARLPPAGLRAYREAYDREARAIFDRAQRAVGIQAKLDVYTEVFDKFLASTVGDDALAAAGDLHLAVGRYYEALAMFRRLIDLYPKDTDRDVAMILTKAAFCAAQIGDHEHRNVLLERLVSEYPAKRLRVEGELISTSELKNHRLLEVRGSGGSTLAPDDWPVAGGNASRSRLSDDLPEDLPRQPFWSYRIAEREPKLRAMYGDWIVFMHDRAPSARPDFKHLAGEFVTPYPTVRPVIHDGMVFYKDYLEIIGRRLGSGSLAPLRTRYRVPDTSTDPQYLYPIGDVRPRTNDALAPKLEAAYRYLDYGGNSLVIGGGMVLTLECRAPPTNLTNVSRATPGPPNTIVAYSRKSGKMIWSWHADFCSVAVSSNPALYRKWRADFEAHPSPVFQGPGVIHGRLLYTLAAEREEMAGVSLWAFDIHTGMVRYRTPLHYPDEMNGLLPRGAALAVAGGVIYITSHAGVVAAVDALPPGRVRWITRYHRNLSRSVRRGGRRRGMGRLGATVKQGFAYNEPLVAGGKVIVAAADSKEIVALDAETGVIAWSASKKALGRMYQLLGVVDGVLVVAGDKVMGIDAAKGERVWGPVDLEGWSHGRGVLSAKYAYLPTHHDGARRSLIERIDVRTGEKIASLEFDVEKLGNLLISDGRLIAA